MDSTNFKLNLNASNSLENVREEDSDLQKLPLELIVTISKELPYNSMLALSTTCKVFAERKVEFLKVSEFFQLQEKKLSLIEAFVKGMDFLS